MRKFPLATGRKREENVEMLKRSSRVLILLLAVTVLLGLTASATVAAPSGARISAHLTKKSFQSSKAGSVKLIYKFSKRSSKFSYKLTLKKGKKWQAVKSVKKKGRFKGTKKMTVKKLFAGKAVKVGAYKLKLSADGGSKTLYFKVLKKPSPPPADCAIDDEACWYGQG
jgi:hypothetical protein